MGDIDDMDFLGYIDVLSWRAQRDEGEILPFTELPFLQPTAGVR